MSIFIKLQDLGSLQQFAETHAVTELYVETDNITSDNDVDVSAHIGTEVLINCGLSDDDYEPLKSWAKAHTVTMYSGSVDYAYAD